jgi:predicted metal-binding protein
MTSKIESDLSTLCEEAKKLGAIDAKAVKSSDIVVDPRVTLKCRVPLCGYYGNSLMCPPNVISASEFQEVLTRYEYAVLVQIEVSIPEEVIQAAKNADNLAELFEDKNYVKRMLSKAKGLGEIVTKIEAMSFNMGYRLAAGFSGGTCTLCDECVTKHPGEPCRHPFQARPAMEAVGIDVIKTVEKAGFKAAAPTMDKLLVYGMVLVD